MSTPQHHGASNDSDRFGWRAVRHGERSEPHAAAELRSVDGRLGCTNTAIPTSAPEPAGLVTHVHSLLLSRRFSHRGGLPHRAPELHQGLDPGAGQRHLFPEPDFHIEALPAVRRSRC